MGGVTVVSKKKGWLFHPPRKGSMVRSLRNSLLRRIWWRQLDTPLVGLSNVAGMYSHRFADELNNNGSDWSWTTQLGRMAKDLEVSGCSNTVSLIPMNSGTWGEPGLWTRLLGHRLTWKGEVRRWSWTSIVNEMIQQGKNRSECEWHFLSHSCILLRLCHLDIVYVRKWNQYNYLAKLVDYAFCRNSTRDSPAKPHPKYWI